MNRYIWIILAFMLGCSSSSDVAITQTGNPPKVSIGISTYNDTTADSSLVRNVKRESNDPHDTISSINITSALMIVEVLGLLGATDSLEFDNNRPYVIDLALDSSTMVLDTVDAINGQVFDTLVMGVTDLTEELDEKLFDSLVEMQDYSMLIKGYVNGDSSKSFTFPFFESVELVTPLSKQIVISNEGQQRVRLVLDIRKWFIDENGEILNPFFPEDRDDIEESILESVMGEEDEHFVEEKEEEEEEHL